jgi:uncharacterized membrane protein
MAVERELEDIARGLLRHSHDHPPVRDVNQEADRRLRRSGRIAADLGRVVGSWSFVLAQVVFLIAWIVLNSVAVFRHWDVYPFLFANLVFSLEAAFAGVLVLMAVNRLGDRDRLLAEQHFEEAVKAEEEVKAVMRHLEVQDEVLLQLVHRLDRSERQLRRIARRLGVDEEARAAG